MRVNARYLLRLKEFHTETLGLLPQALGKFHSADTLWKTGHILKTLRPGRLPAKRGALDNQGVDEFPSSVQGRSQSGWTTTQNDQIVMGAACFGLQPQFSG